MTRRRKQTRDRRTALRERLRRDFALDYFEADVLISDLTESLATLGNPLQNAGSGRNTPWAEIAAVADHLRHLAKNLEDADLTSLADGLQKEARTRTRTALRPLAKRFGQLVSSWETDEIPGAAKAAGTPTPNRSGAE